ncbi:conserved hypothetical protein [Gloeothece citriformis PCC 7424]|uniref:Lipid-A-disaccharide synthase n=1 Tax=Gloeothece citriformis (strain PCC 7424) TaxID=65393 RepID=B7KD63_GLOC7|nr:lipid-A-disaccharide synthase-related protein [Gloeothece citriformis]ACK73184.1 conserved hypothetical protein [Gloeothece citriformis PCC 7424]
MKLLILSNGHGEDVIAVKILQHLQNHPQSPKLAALPLVGEGYAYRNLNISIIGPVQEMPSGGFITMEGKHLWKDLNQGLLNLTQKQYQIVRQWGESGGKILAVGDILPLLLAWLSGGDYAFVGTAKSEYYWQDEYGYLPQTPWIYRWSGSYYFPWERFLMSRPRCKAVFPRDTLTTSVLRQWSIPAFDLGNPMMDDISLEPLSTDSTFNSFNDKLTIVLLPGSRTPEALRNWHTILTAVREIISTFKDKELVFLGAIAPALSLDPFQDDLMSQNWERLPLDALNYPLNDPHKIAFTYHNTPLILSQNAYIECLKQAQIAIAMAGTATEQFIGLGKPAITIIGQGPQFTETFALAQTRLLGISLTLVEHPQQVPNAIQSLLKDPDRWQLMRENGRTRMGLPGAAKRIAQSVIEQFA